MEKDYQPINASQLKPGLRTCALRRSPHLAEAEIRLAPQRDRLPEKDIVENTKDHRPGSVSNRNPGRNQNGGDCDNQNLHVPWP